MHECGQEEVLMARASGADLASIPPSRAVGRGAAARPLRPAGPAKSVHGARFLRARELALIVSGVVEVQLAELAAEAGTLHRPRASRGISLAVARLARPAFTTPSACLFSHSDVSATIPGRDPVRAIAPCGLRRSNSPRSGR